MLAKIAPLFVLKSIAEMFISIVTNIAFTDNIFPVNLFSTTLSLYILNALFCHIGFGGCASQKLLQMNIVKRRKTNG